MDTQKPAKDTYNLAGAGIAIGAAIGMLFGLMLLENPALGAGAGAGIGLVLGAAVDANRRKQSAQK